MSTRKLVPYLIYLLISCHQMSLAFKSIILSSFGNVHTPQFVDVFKNVLGNKNGHLVYVPTAQYVVDVQSSKSIGEQRRRARYDSRQKLKILMGALRMERSTILELDSPALNKQKLSAILNEASVLYVDGGNTFYLQKYVLETEFWNVAKGTLRNGCVYIGASAGGIIAGKSIETAYWKGWDNPKAAGEDYEWSKEKLRGGNICNDNSFFMHYDSGAHKALVDSNAPELGHPLRTVGDNSACVYYPSEHSGVAPPMLYEQQYDFGTAT